MKVRCPNCGKVLRAPDEWAGRKAKCPGCKRPVPLPEDGSSSPDDGLGFDLGTLDSIESAGEAVVHERRAKPMTLKEAQAAAEPAPAATDPLIRSCPHCGQKVRVADPYTEVMCRHCGAGIPGLEADRGKKAKYMDSMKNRIKTEVSFYTGFTSAALYPVPAISSILLGMGIALAIIALPVSGVLAFLSASALNPVAAKEQPDLGWVGVFLTVMFVAEGVYFGSVGYYALIDSIRATTAGNEQPPQLTWNITKLGAALGGYAALVGFYLVVILLLPLASGRGFPPGREDIVVLSEPVNLIILALMTFSVPMNMIGLSSGHALDGLNPLRAAVSIGRVIGHYVFLFLIVLIYLGFYVGLMYAVMSWAGPAIMQAAREGIAAGYLNMLGGIAAWSLVMGAGFYFAYSIGRILGLFARTYKESLEFEL